MLATVMNEIQDTFLSLRLMQVDNGFAWFDLETKQRLGRAFSTESLAVLWLRDAYGPQCVQTRHQAA